jgi:hypothetical protein
MSSYLVQGLQRSKCSQEVPEAENVIIAQSQQARDFCPNAYANPAVSYCLNGEFFTTYKGYFGIGPKDLQEDDLIMLELQLPWPH